MLTSIALAAALTAGNHTFLLGERSYIVHVPAAQGALPVVINLHGGGSNAESQQRYSGMDAVADREHFIVVYPNVTGRGRFLVWNAGTCCGRAPMQHIDDVGFIRLWKMSGSGHVWPGRDSKVERILGKPNHLIDANEEMWAFFRGFRR